MKWFVRIFGTLVVLLILALVLNPRVEGGGEKGKEDKEAVRPADPSSNRDREGLNREAAKLVYSKHARCRMGCRQIDEQEVVDILRNGVINYAKSDLRGNPDPKYAVEGLTRDGQKVRIIFAQSPRGVVVVTVIDLKNEWRCDCK